MLVALGTRAVFASKKKGQISNFENLYQAYIGSLVPETRLQCALKKLMVVSWRWSLGDSGGVCKAREKVELVISNFLYLSPIGSLVPETRLQDALNVRWCLLLALRISLTLTSSDLTPLTSWCPNPAQIGLSGLQGSWKACHHVEEIAVGERLVKFLSRHCVFFRKEFKHVFVGQNQEKDDAQEIVGFQRQS